MSTKFYSIGYYTALIVQTKVCPQDKVSAYNFCAFQPFQISWKAQLSFANFCSTR